MKSIIATAAIAGACATFALLNVGTVSTGNSFLATPMTDAERHFINFVTEHKRSYATKEEYEHRLSIFTKSLELVEKHNSEGHSYTLGINKFADMTQ